VYTISFNHYRKYCGLPEANTFEELFGSMPNETVRRYSTIFEWVWVSIKHCQIKLSFK